MLGFSATLVIGAAPPETAPAIDVERGMKRCRVCHGDDLHGKKTVPPIAGLHPKRIQRKLTTEVPKKMAPIDITALSADQAAVAITSLEPDLAFILDDCKVPGWLQSRLGAVGVTTNSVLARLGGEEEKVRSWLETKLKVDPNGDIQNRVAEAQFLNAWDVAR